MGQKVNGQEEHANPVITMNANKNTLNQSTIKDQPR
jgi:hypothetical protein